MGSVSPNRNGIGLNLLICESGSVTVVSVMVVCWNDVNGCIDDRYEVLRSPRVEVGLGAGGNETNPSSYQLSKN